MAFGNTIRHALRTATRQEHDQLDQAMTEGDLSTQTGYARFLAIQLAARAPIEAWFGPGRGGIAPPPSQCHLLRDDLAVMGLLTPFPKAPFDVPASHALGAAWAIAGSSLGNRAILGGLRKRGLVRLPTAFLADEAMPAYFAALRPAIERAPTGLGETEAAIAGARAVFAQFSAVISSVALSEAA